MAQSDSALSVRDRSFSFFFNATPWPRATPLPLDPRPIPFFSLTPHRGTERHGLGAKNEERESNTTGKNGASKRAGSGHPVAQSDTALSDRDRCYLSFPKCHRVAQRRHSLSPRPKRYLVFLSYNHHLISKEFSVEISQLHVEHWVMLPNSSLKLGSSFQKESHVTWRHKDTNA